MPPVVESGAIWQWASAQNSAAPSSSFAARCICDRAATRDTQYYECKKNTSTYCIYVASICGTLSSTSDIVSKIKENIISKKKRKKEKKRRRRNGATKKKNPRRLSG